METRTVLNNIELRRGDDNVYWLRFRTDNGREGMIDVAHYFHSDTIVDSAIRQWAMEQFPSEKE